MAGSAVIGSLRVNLGMDSAAFAAGANGAQKSLSSLATKMKTASLAISAGMTVALGGAAIAFRKTADAADELAKKSQAIGVPIEDLSRLKYAADLSGVSFESLSTSVARLSRSMSDVAAGAGAEAKRAFDQLGISVTDSDGKLKSASVIMGEVAGKFASMEDGSAKTAIAMQIFGRAGADLIPLLNSGQEGLAQMAAEADKLGITISGETAKAAERFNDNLTRLSTAGAGLGVAMTTALLPAMETITNQLVAAAGAVSEWIVPLMQAHPQLVTWGAAIAGIGVVLGPLVITLGLVATGIAAISLPVAATVAGIALLTGAVVAFWPEIKAAGEAVNGFLISIGDAVKEKLAAVAELFIGLKTSALEAMGQLYEGLKAVLVDKMTALVELVMAPIRQIEAGFGWLYEQVIGGSWIPVFLLGIAEHFGTLDAVMVQPVTDATNAVSDAFEQTAAGAAAAAQKIASATMEMSQDFDDGGKQSTATGEAMAMSWQDQTGSMIGSFKTIAETFGEENQKIAVAAKAFAIAEAIWNAYRAASNALATIPWPAGIAAAAAAVATGIGYVAKIASTPIPSYDKGGSFMVGGQPGIDKNLVSMNLTKGERVDITPASEVGRETIVSVPMKGSKFTQDDFYDFVDGLNRAMRNGAKLNGIKIVPA